MPIVCYTRAGYSWVPVYGWCQYKPLYASCLWYTGRLQQGTSLWLVSIQTFICQLSVIHRQATAGYLPDYVLSVIHRETKAGYQFMVGLDKKR